MPQASGIKFGKRLAIHLPVFLLQSNDKLRFPNRCEEQGHERNDWENWNYSAKKVKTVLHVTLELYDGFHRIYHSKQTLPIVEPGYSSYIII